jgi:RimJ/RimL family protein N-acetyltransferase
VTSRPSNQLFLLFAGEELAGMSAYLGIDPDRQVLEIGNTYYRPHLRGTGFNLRVKDMMLRRAFDCGIRRVEFRVDSRNARSLAAMAKIGAVREACSAPTGLPGRAMSATRSFLELAEEWLSTAG